MIGTPGKFRAKQRFGTFQLDKKNFSVGRINDSTSFTDTINTLNSGKKDLNIKISGLPEYITAEISPEILKPNQRGKLIITFNASEVKRYGPYNDKLFFKINDDKNSVPFSISAFVEKDFTTLTQEDKENAPNLVFLNNKINIGTIKKDVEYEAIVQIRNTGKSDLEIYNIFVIANMEVTDFSKKIKPGEMGSIHVNFVYKGNSSVVSKPVKVYSNDYKHFESICFINANLEPEKIVEFSITADELIKKLSQYSKVKTFTKNMKLQKNNNITIIDLRNNKLYENEHIPNAINIEYNSYAFNKLIPLFESKERTYILYSNDDKTSQKALKFFHNLNFKKVNYLKNGFTAWKRQNPKQKKESTLIKKSY